MPLPRGTRGILTDIEGTTTPISFVHDVLFPYAAERLEEACAEAASRPEVAAALARLREEYDAERASSASSGASAASDPLPGFGSGAPYARHLMTRDRKSPGLKELQGIVWRDGYASGELRGEVFPDVPEALRAWRAAGLRLRVFSSGSELAQRLLFGSTAHGDLTPLFEGFHDTTTGLKREAASYAAIARAFELDPASILFLSDVTAELDAAASTGLSTGLLVRPGNAPPDPGRHPSFRSFLELLP